MIVYWFENVTYAYKTWDTVFEDIVKYLETNFSATVIKKTNSREPSGNLMYIDKFDFYMQDCELLIYDEKLDILKAISYCESYSPIWNIFKNRNKKEDLLLITQLYNWFNKDPKSGTNAIDLEMYDFTFYTTVFYPLFGEINDPLKNPYHIDYEKLFQERQQISWNELEDKMFMLFTTERIDPISLAKLGYLNKDLTPQNNKVYFEKMVKYKMGLAIGTTAEYSYREFEYMAIGIPFIRIEYMTDLNPPLIPNYHYIAIDRKKYELPYNNGLDRLGGPQYVKAYIERFNEVKDDRDLLNFVAENARNYYQKYSSKENRLDHMLKLLRIK